MDNTATAFLLNVGFIVNESIGYSETFNFEFPQIIFDDDFKLDDFVSEVSIHRSNDGLSVQAKFGASTELVCGRCLESFVYLFECEFSELYTFSSQADADTELKLPASNIINLAPLVREYAILAIPLSPLCRDDCHGLCPVCGVNRNVEACDCKTELIDSRMAVLKSLLDDE
ncbi:MAG: DUF177 domain-containing protein [Chloroflexota bacterium]|nr:DUF177 domain-containing protein [Chloroflexota bacterium]